MKNPQLLQLTWICFGVLFLIMGCLGKTAVRNIYYISPKKRMVFIAPPINYTDEFMIDEQVQDALKKIFNARIRFAVVDKPEDSDLYVLVHLENYSQEEVSDYGFGNTELTLNASIFVSDSQYEDHGDSEQVGRYYFKNRRINIEMVDKVNTENTSETAEALKTKGIGRLAETIHSLMETGKIPPESIFYQ